ncbi:MAG TPA: hypothetical protein VMU42_11605, partial [Candidatus Sulfotelmatobacter sp.]|nr:hypothetical protein [Candidatus Sulfotelmatobacter sp.]
MTQTALTIVTRISEGQVEPLRAELDPAGTAAGPRLLERFAALPILHFACLFIADATPELPACLVFEASIDGAADDFVDRLLGVAGDELDAVYRYCADYPGSAGRQITKAFLLCHDFGAVAFFVGCPGRSVGQIRREAALHMALQGVIDGGAGGAGNHAGDIMATARALRSSLPDDFSWAMDTAARPFLVSYGKAVVVAIAVAIMLVLVLLADLLTPVGLLLFLTLPIAAFLAALRWHELHDDAAMKQAPVAAMPAREVAILELESRPGRVQNHLASVTCVKSGVFRLATLKFVLRSIDVLGRLLYNR